MCSYPIDAVKHRVNKLLKKYPEHEEEIMRTLDVSGKLSKKLTMQEKQDLLNPDELLLQYAERVDNQSFEHQQKIHKVLIEEAGGDSASEFEQTDGELSTREEPTYEVKPNRRIFKWLTLNDKNVILPQPKQ